MCKLFTRKRLVILLLIVGVVGCFWKPMLAHSSHFIRRHTFGREFAAGKDLYLQCFSDMELVSFGGRLGIKDLRRFADDPALAAAGRSRARDAVAYWDGGFFARDYVNFYRENADSYAADGIWRWFNIDFWLATTRADYIEYLAKGAPLPPAVPQE